MHKFKVSVSFLMFVHIVSRSFLLCSFCAWLVATLDRFVNSPSKTLHKIVAHYWISVGVSTGLTILSILSKTDFKVFSTDLTNFFFSKSFLRDDIKFYTLASSSEDTIIARVGGVDGIIVIRGTLVGVVSMLMFTSSIV